MIEVIYKEAAGEHALDGACFLHLSNRIIAAHILAGAAAAVLQRVAIEATGFSITAALWEAAEELGDGPKNNINKSYNFLKHADRDFSKELHFDKTLTAHILFLATIDLLRIARCRPSKDGYTVAVSDHVMRCFNKYLESHQRDQMSLCGLKDCVGRDGADAYRGCIYTIKGWLTNNTNILLK
jgi:hypothetical protein